MQGMPHASLALKACEGRGVCHKKGFEMRGLYVGKIKNEVFVLFDEKNAYKRKK